MSDPGSGGAGPRLQGTDEAERAAKEARSLPPVHLWDPPDRGDSRIVIRRDGTWEHDGDPIRREALVRLFGSILRREENGTYYLVTPAEKQWVTVEDAPFLAIELDRQGEGHDQTLTFRTNVGDRVMVDETHPMRLQYDEGSEEPRPYVLVRDRLEALIARPVFYDLVELGTEEEIGGTPTFGVWSAGHFFPFAESASLGGS